MTNSETQKDSLENLSAEKWLLDLKEKGYFTHFDQEMGTVARFDSALDKRGQYHGFASRWQLEQLLAYGDTICIDGTHKIYGHDTNLFTIVVKSDQTQSGIPVAFLLTRSPKTDVVTMWLRALKDKLRSDFHKDYSPRVAVMDMGHVEFSAVKQVFPEARIFFCVFHVLQAWNRNFSDENLGLIGTDSNIKKSTKHLLSGFIGQRRASSYLVRSE
ncbi:hypothetical protein BGZ65_010487 [Modicella reniformis]|uniref:MULE transposase domain-containing protein n=1 Tax=Modicella reniformis TaxID=1440133 RepID=A0A9P6IMF0_9FUNG|nr:hypothetical protein BGZ65_010487 [Modicella reniformis]